MPVRLSKKVCLLGDFAVGKTSLVRRFVHDLFDDKYITTIGVKVSRKTVVVPSASDVVELTMMLWDLAGCAEFDQVRASYLRGTAGAVLVCDVTRPETLDGLRFYVDDLLSVSGDAQFVVVANKIDLIEQQQIAPADVEAVVERWDVPFFLTSAKTGEEVQRLFRHLGRLLLFRG